jgi:hypothetical protein
MQEIEDKNGDIGYNKIFEWMLPTLDSESFWDFLATRMRSYMMHLMIQGWKPQWFDLDSGSSTLSNHVAHIFGCQQCRAIQRFLSIDNSWLL